VAYTYVLPKDIEAAIKQLNDQELDRLVSAASEVGGKGLSQNKASANDLPILLQGLCRWGNAMP
jgi:hypothetical protein